MGGALLPFLCAASRYCRSQRQVNDNKSASAAFHCHLKMSVTLEIKESHSMRVAILDDEPAELRRVEQTLQQIPGRGEQG